MQEGTTRWGAILTEVGRIRRYKVKGDVATDEELKRYVAWLKNGESL